MVKEGSFTIIRGKQRAGKTLYMAIRALEAYQNNRCVFTNIEYEFDHTPLYFQQLDLNDESTVEEIRGSVITLDEMWMLLDARSGLTGPSKKFSRWLYQVKKQGVDLYGTTHELDLIDKRARNNFDWMIDVQALPTAREEDEPPTAILLHIQNGPLRDFFSRKKLLHLHPSWLGLYDSGNVFDPLEPPPDFKEAQRNKAALNQTNGHHQPRQYAKKHEFDF